MMWISCLFSPLINLVGMKEGQWVVLVSRVSTVWWNTQYFSIIYFVRSHCEDWKLWGFRNAYTDRPFTMIVRVYIEKPTFVLDCVSISHCWMTLLGVLCCAVCSICYVSVVGRPLQDFEIDEDKLCNQTRYILRYWDMNNRYSTFKLKHIGTPFRSLGIKALF